jgi:tetratricopeptide (TPR) repeat protein
VASKREGLIASAEKLLAKGKIDAALREYLRVLEETPGDINILNKVGDLFVRLNRNEDSIPYFTRIAEHYSKDGFFLKSIAIYKKINKLDPARLEVYERLAELYAKQGLGMEAKSQYQVLADYYAKQDNTNGSIGIYQKMSATEPQNIQLHVKLADLYTQAKRVPEALKEYAIVAAMLRDRGAFDESVQVYEKALKLQPDNLEILKSFVPRLIDTGRVEEARVALRHALETTPRSVPLFVMAADAAYVANDIADARALITKAQAVDPANEDVLTATIKIQLKARRPDLAFVAAVPLAQTAIKRGEAKRALAVLEPVARAAPDNEDILKKVIEIASTAGDEVASIPYRSALAELFRKSGKSAEAADLLRICARLAPDILEFRARLAQLEPQSAASRPPELERQREITLSGVDRVEAVRFPGDVQAEPPPASPLDSMEFEFSLEDGETSDESARAAPVQDPSLLYSRDFAAPSPVEETRPGFVPIERATPPPPPDLGGSDSFQDEYGGHASAADAIAEFEARQAAARAGEVPSGIDAVEEADEIIELPDGAELPPSGPPAAYPVVRPPAETPVPLDFGDEPHAQRPLRSPHAPASPGLDALGSLDDFGFGDVPIAPAPPPARRAPMPSMEFSIEDDFEPAPASPAHPSPAPPPSAFAPPPEPVAAAPQPPPAVPRPPSAPSAPIVAPAPPARRPPSVPSIPAIGMAEAAIEEVIVESDVFRKYGLLEKAADQLKTFLKDRPDALRVREKLFEIYLEQGKKGAARREADALKEVYRAHGREDRVKALDTLLVEPEPPAAAPVEDALRGLAAPKSAAPRAPKPVSAREIEIPLPPPPPPLAKSRPAATAAQIELPKDLIERKPAKPAPLKDRPAPSLEAVKGLEAELKKPVPGPPEPRPEKDLLAGLHTPPPMPPLGAEPTTAPTSEELAQLDFCLDQGMVVDAAELLQTLEGKYPDDTDVAARRARLEGTKTPAAEEARPPLQDILSEDLELVLDAELGRALTDEMARSGPIPRPEVPARPASTPGTPAIDESGLFSDEQEFFNFAEELQTEMKQDPAAMPVQPEQGGEVSLEEIFREFKKGVEQQLSPEDYETHYNLGIAYKEMGLTDEAIGEFQLASKDPLHAVECCSMLGLCFLEKGLPQLAIKWYKKGLETIGIREEDRLGLQYDLATVYVEVGDRESAYKTFLDIYGSNAQYRDVGDKLKELAPA